MSRKRGLSVEEKRQRMMEFFYEKKDFFLLKELEKQCQKEKGITSMSVKDIVTSLVDDGMVDTDKIGTSIYFWAFPSKASQNRKRKIDDLEQNLNMLKERKLLTEEKIKKSKVGKEETPLRDKLLEEVKTFQQKHKSLQEEVEKYKECDPEVMEQYKKDVFMAKDAANRWTDNIFNTKSWIKKKFAFQDNVIDKQFGLPEDFDYID